MHRFMHRARIAIHRSAGGHRYFHPGQTPICTLISTFATSPLINEQGTPLISTDAWFLGITPDRDGP
jgi:hypothetical protein